MNQDRWVVRFDAPRAAGEGPSRRMFCFPHMGGTASAYRRFRRFLPASVELCAIQLPGREERFSEPAARSMRCVVDAVAEVIAAGDDVPFAVFGHSLGAIMAYEVSVQLEKSDRAPEFICVSSCRPPHVRDAPVEERWDDERLFTRVASMGEIPRELLSDPESREMCLANIRADWELYAGYTAPSLRCVDRPIVVMYGDADPDCSKEDAEAWGRYTRRSTKVIPFAGGHFYLKDCWREIAKECLWLFQAPGREV